MPNRAEALAITWGGAAACRDCQALRRDYEHETGEELPPGFCYINRTGEGCVNPSPQRNTGLLSLWDLWERTKRRQLRVGMDAELMGRDMIQVGVYAAALHVVMDGDFLLRWNVLEAAEILQESKRRKRRKA